MIGTIPFGKKYGLWDIDCLIRFEFPKSLVRQKRHINVVVGTRLIAVPG